MDVFYDHEKQDMVEKFEKTYLWNACHGATLVCSFSSQCRQGLFATCGMAQQAESMQSISYRNVKSRLATKQGLARGTASWSRISQY